MGPRKMKKQVASKEPPDMNANTAQAYLPETSLLSVSNTEVSEVDNPGFSADHDEIQLEQRILSALRHHTSQPPDAERSVAYSHFTISVTEPPTLALTLLRDADIATLIKKDSDSETYALPLPYRRSFGTIGEQWWAGLLPAEARAGPFASNQEVKTAEKALKDKEKRRIRSLNTKKGIQKTRRADLREALRRQVLHLPMEGIISDTAEQEAMEKYGKKWQDMLQDLDEDDNGLHKIQRVNPSKNNRRRKSKADGLLKARNEIEGLGNVQMTHTNKNMPVLLRKPDEGIMAEEQYDEDAMVSQDDENPMVENQDDEDFKVKREENEDIMMENQDEDAMEEIQEDEDTMAESQNDEDIKMENQDDEDAMASQDDEGAMVEDEDAMEESQENVMVSQDDEDAMVEGENNEDIMMENQDDVEWHLHHPEEGAIESQGDEDAMVEGQDDDDSMVSQDEDDAMKNQDEDVIAIQDDEDAMESQDDEDAMADSQDEDDVMVDSQDEDSMMSQSEEDAMAESQKEDFMEESREEDAIEESHDAEDAIEIQNDGEHQGEWDSEESFPEWEDPDDYDYVA